MDFAAMDFQNVPFTGTLIVMASAREVVGEPGFDLVLPDGTNIWMPAAAFQANFRINGAMRFGDALEYLRRGHRMARDAWSGAFLQLAPDGAEIQHFESEDKVGEIWMVADDILAEDWRLVP